MTETRAEPFTPAERAVMAARAEAAEWRARAERAEARVADKHAAWMTANAEANDYYTALRAMEARVVAFAGQLQAWDLNDAADELLKEIIGGTVKAPDYYALKAERDEARAEAAEWRARYEDVAQSAQAQRWLEAARERAAMREVVDAAVAETDAEEAWAAARYPEIEVGTDSPLARMGDAKRARRVAVAALRAEGGSK